jgi:hypothetical protein
VGLPSPALALGFEPDLVLLPTPLQPAAATIDHVAALMGYRLSSPASSRRRRCTLGQQLIQVLGDLALDRLAESTEQEAELGAQVEMVGCHDERAVDTAALELDRILRLAFDHGAFHVEALLDFFGPRPGDFACLGQAQLVRAMDLDVGHLATLR